MVEGKQALIGTKKTLHKINRRLSFASAVSISPSIHVIFFGVELMAKWNLL